MKYYVVADIHGFYTALIEVLTEKGFFEDKEPHKLIVCGDLFDRGLETAKLQEFIVDLMDKDEVILIRGNHEDLAIELVKNFDKWMTPNILYTHHWKNGTVETILNLVGMNIVEAYNNIEECKKRIVKTPFFNRIIPSMKNYFETDNYIFVHGWIPCDALGYGGKVDTFIHKQNWRELSDFDWDYARWYNGMEAARQGVIEPNKTIICGHWHCSYGHAKIEGVGSEFDVDADFSPYKSKGIIAIDACTAHSKKINCVVIED